MYLGSLVVLGGAFKVQLMQPHDFLGVLGFDFRPHELWALGHKLVTYV